MCPSSLEQAVSWLLDATRMVDKTTHPAQWAAAHSGLAEAYKVANLVGGSN